jgi:hypothetical protein
LESPKLLFLAVLKNLILFNVQTQIKTIGGIGMPRELYEIRRLLEDGISQEVSAQDFEVYELQRLVESAVEGNAMIYIVDSDQLETYEVERIAEEGKQNVVFR